MSESTTHMTLVGLLANWIAYSLLHGDYGYMLIDAPDRNSQQKPPTIYNFIPDVYVWNAPNHDFIIGEAKTASDIDNRHTIQQFKSFLQKCGESENSLFVLAVPWYQVGLAESIIRYCKRKIALEEVRTKVLEKLPG